MYEKSICNATKTKAFNVKEWERAKREQKSTKANFGEILKTIWLAFSAPNELCFLSFCFMFASSPEAEKWETSLDFRFSDSLNGCSTNEQHCYDDKLK